MIPQLARLSLLRNSWKMKAEYKCLKCGWKYESNPGPTQCPACHHDYVKWVNYEEMRKEWNKTREKYGRPPM